MSIFQQARNSFDVSGICLGTVGFILLVGYVVFAFLVTHRGDFYQIRRWKAAICFSSISMALILVVVVYIFVTPGFSAWSSESMVEIAGHILGTLMATLVFIVPVLFAATWKIWDQLRWSVQADDFLDKIWKDPNKEHRSPIQEI